MKSLAGPWLLLLALGGAPPDAGASESTAEQAAALLAKGQTEQGLRLIEAELERLRAQDRPAELLALAATQVEMLEQAGRPREALQKLQALAQLQDELRSAERRRAAAALQARIAGEQQSQEIERLRLVAERSRAELTTREARQQLLVASGLVALLVCVILLQWLIRSYRRQQALNADHAQLEDQSVKDALTGVYNRRHAEGLLQKLQAAPAAAVGLLLLDVDRFKRINDGLGHAAGDEVLKGVARRLEGLMRKDDAVVRWGGEEFLLLLPGSSDEGSRRFAHRLLAAVAEPGFEVGSATPLRVTVSAGLVSWPAWPGQSWEQAVLLADLALYRAKSGGRNQTIAVTPLRPLQASELESGDLQTLEEQGALRIEQLLGPDHSPDCNEVPR